MANENYSPGKKNVVKEKPFGALVREAEWEIINFQTNVTKHRCEVIIEGMA